MSLKDLIPWKRSEKRELSRERALTPMLALQHEMNRLFDDFFSSSLTAWPFSESALSVAEFPRMDIEETEKDVIVTAELPGLEEDDFEVTLHEGYLTLRGEKKQESKTDEKNFQRIERTYGSFQRTIPLPCEVDAENVDARFKNGVLKITLHKMQPAEPARKITVRKGD